MSRGRAIALALLPGLILGLGGLWTIRQGLVDLRANERAAQRALELSAARCEPVYLAAYPELGCRARLGWPPISCSPQLHVYRHEDLERVKARAQAWGQRAGMVVYEERGGRERKLEVSWIAEIKGAK